MKLGSIMAIGLILFACGTTKTAVEEEVVIMEEVVEVEEMTETAKPPRDIPVKAVVGSTKEESDPITINDAKIVGNDLLLEVAYSGGCNDHTFECYGSMAVMKSFPPKRSVQLVHHANGDHCRGYITTNLVIDISDIGDGKEPGRQMYLMLEGWKGELLYTYE